jgi:hypothetical protein
MRVEKRPKIKLSSYATLVKPRTQLIYLLVRRAGWDANARNASKYRFLFPRVAPAIYLAMLSKSGNNYVCFYTDAGNAGTISQ